MRLVWPIRPDSPDMESDYGENRARNSFTFSPDGTCFMTGSCDKSPNRNGAEEKIERTLKGYSFAWWDVATQFRIWKTIMGKRERKMEKRSEWRQVAFSSDMCFIRSTSSNSATSHSLSSYKAYWLWLLILRLYNSDLVYLAANIVSSAQDIRSSWTLLKFALKERECLAPTIDFKYFVTSSWTCEHVCLLLKHTMGCLRYHRYPHL